MSKATLVTNKTNIRYLSKFTGSSGFMLLAGKKQYLFTDFRYIQRAKNTIPKNIELIDSTKLWKDPETLKKNWQKILKDGKIEEIGVEESDITLKTYNFFKKISPKIKFSSSDNETEKLRAVKTAEEITLIEESQRINEKALVEIIKFIHAAIRKKRQITEAEAAWKIKLIGHELGAEDVSFDPIVAFGPNSASPHHEPGRSGLQPKPRKPVPIMIDMGMKYNGYCSDMTRVFFTDTPTPRQEEIYNTVLSAQEAALENIKAGVTGAEADKYAREIIVEAGYGEQYGHAGGHGVGLDIHESPSLSDKYTDPIPEGAIITIEPGIYLEGEFGIRIEDMCLVTKSGNENLTSVPKDLSRMILK